MNLSFDILLVNPGYVISWNAPESSYLLNALGCHGGGRAGFLKVKKCQFLVANKKPIKYLSKT